MTRFPTTQWSLIEMVHREARSGSREQMGQLLQLYWQPLYAHLRYKGLSNEKAEDLIQEFMLELLDNDLVAIADPRKGKFRSLLLTALDRFAISRHRYESAAKRSPGSIASLDAAETDNTTTDDNAPTAAYEKAWALGVLANALTKMKSDCEKAGQEIRWTVFERRIAQPLLSDVPPPDYSELTEALGLENDKSTMNLLVTAKRQFSRTLRDQVRSYVTRNSDTSLQVEGVAKRMMSEVGDHETAIRVANQFTEQSIAEDVENEIRQLKQILADTKSREAVYLAAASELPPEQHQFLLQLSDHKDSGQVSQLFDWDQGVSEEVPKQVLLQSALDSDLSDFVAGYSGTIRECLCGGEASLEQLEAFKDWANMQRSSRWRSLHADITSVLYYTSIAAAIGQHGQRITGLNDEALDTGFQSVLSHDWLDDDVRPVVTKAISELQAPSKKKTEGDS